MAHKMIMLNVKSWDLIFKKDFGEYATFSNLGGGMRKNNIFRWAPYPLSALQVDTAIPVLFLESPILLVESSRNSLILR